MCVLRDNHGLCDERTARAVGGHEEQEEKSDSTSFSSSFVCVRAFTSLLHRSLCGAVRRRFPPFLRARTLDSLARSSEGDVIL